MSKAVIVISFQEKIVKKTPGVDTAIFQNIKYSLKHMEMCCITRDRNIYNIISDITYYVISEN